MMLLQVFVEDSRKVEEVLALSMPEAKIVMEKGSTLGIECNGDPAVVRGVIQEIPGVLGAVWME